MQLVDDLRAGKEVSSTRGPRLCTWQQAERVLAGFPDGLADEGPGAGAASLAGLNLARENSWTAPGATGSQGTKDTKSVETGTAKTKRGAAAQADTSRAETETTQAESTGEGGKK